MLGVALRGSTCRQYSGDLRLRVLATGLATYPDAAVICGSPLRDPASTTHVLREYVLVAQNTRSVDVFARPPSGAWTHRTYGSSESFELPSLGLSLPVDDLYDAAGVLTA